MLSQKGDSCVYLLYSCVRLNSILRKYGGPGKIGKGPFKFTDKNEIALA